MIEEPDDYYRNVEITGEIPPELEDEFVESLKDAKWNVDESCVVGDKGSFYLAEDRVPWWVMIDTFKAIAEFLHAHELNDTVIAYKECISETFDEFEIGFLRACDADADEYLTFDLDDALEKERQRLVAELRAEAAPKP